MSRTAASVLAVDDNATVRRALAMRLGANGFNVVTAEGGDAAFAALNAQEFDLVLLDLQMPGMRGDEILRRLRHQYSESQLPVIMLASSDDKDDITRTLDLGANDYVIKPGDLPILVARINTQLSLKATRAALRRHEQEHPHRSSDHGATVARFGSVTVGAFATTWPTRSSTERSQPTPPVHHDVLYDNTPITCLTLDRNFEVLFANKFALQFLGYPLNELTSRSFVSLYAEEDQPLAAEYLRGVLEQPNRLHRWEIRRQRKNGTTVWMRETARQIGHGAETVVVMTCEDIDDTYKLAEKLSYHAIHDELTGLSNRRMLEERLGQVIDSARNEHSRHALAIIDIDQFKIINDTCGHAAGDELLKQAAHIIKNVARRRDIVARVGGDEFGVLFEDCEIAIAINAAEAVRAELTQFQFAWEGAIHRISVSVGIVEIAQDCEGVTAALSMADTACYAAKDAGRNRLHVYRADNTSVVARQGQMRWVTRIKDALHHDRFELSLQLITPLSDKVAYGDHYELLLRMRDEGGELILPNEFLPAAERYNLAPEIDRWVVAHALSWLHAHPELLARLHLCGINLSGQSFGDDEVLKFILDQLDRYAHSFAHKICFEVTETAAISDIVNANRFIATLRSRGCRFALDDFGSGFSSFAYLKNLALDFIKIDGAFVRDMAHDSIDLAMVRSINEIGQVMGVQTIAEFVENQPTLELLRSLGVDFAQGYAIGVPLPIYAFH